MNENKLTIEEKKLILLQALKEAIATENFAQIVNKTKIKKYCLVFNDLQDNLIKISDK
jgi:hypothetical protein